MKRALILAGLAAASAAAFGQTVVPDNPSGAVTAALSLLKDRGLEPAAGDLSSALLEAVVKAADAGGRLLSAAGRKEMELQNQGLFRGVGVDLAVTNGQTSIAAVADGSPAAQAGVKPGDVLSRVQHDFVTGQPLERQLEKIRGGTNDVLELTVMRPGEKTPRNFNLPVRYLRRPAVRRTEELTRKLALMDLNGVWPGVADAIGKQWREWEKEGRTGIILDLRKAEGGDRKEAAAVAALLAKPGALLFAFTDRRGGAREEFKAPADAGSVHLPIMVLIGPETTGAAEVLAAALKSGGRGALLLGGTTHGDAMVREPLPLSDGRSLYAATRRLLVSPAADAAPVEIVAPQIPVAEGRAPAADPKSEMDTADFNPRRKSLELEKEDRILRARVRNDAVLQRAVDILMGLQALKSDGREPAAAPAN